MEDLLTKKEVAKKLGISITTLNRKIRNGDIKAIKLGANKQSPIRIKTNEIERYFKKFEK